MKICWDCKDRKRAAEFYRCSSSDDGRQGRCKQCHKIWRRKDFIENKKRQLRQAKIWSKNNPDKVREMQRRARRKHRDKLNAACTRWRRKNPELSRSISLASYRKHTAQRCEDSRRWYAKNRKRANRRARNWKAKNRARCVAYRYARAHREKQNGGNFTQAQWKALCDLFDKHCVCCLRVRKLTVDHILPVALGGSNDIKNIQPLCKRCNLIKSRKYIDYRKDAAKRLQEIRV
jgi:hypothetical protein